MKKLILGFMAVVFIVLLSGCDNLQKTVENVFERNWKEMSANDKKLLEAAFEKNGNTNPEEYWDLCAEMDVDTVGRKNPWAKLPISRPTSINVYIDNSSSMKGYFQSPNVAPLIEVLSGLTQYYHNNITGYYVEKDSLKEYNWNNLLSDLTAKKLSNYSDAFQLDGLIRQIMEDYTRKSSKFKVISFILTDGIPSGTNEEINQSEKKRFNITSASTLQARIATSVGLCEGIGASVYQFSSGFDGKYWQYNNNSVVKHWLKRPFYLIAIGDKELILELAEKEQSGLQFFKANNKVHFCAVNKSEIQLTSNVFEGGSTKISATAFEEEDKERLSIHVQLSLSGFPYFVRTQSFLENNARITLDGKPVTDFKVEGKMLTIPMTVERIREYKLNIKIRNTTPSWVEEATCLDDKLEDDASLVNKTFNLKYLVEGLKNALTGSHGDVTLFEKTFVICTDNENNE